MHEILEYSNYCLLFFIHNPHEILQDFPSLVYPISTIER